MEKIPTAEEFFLNSYFSDSISQEDKELWLECNNQAKESIKIMIEFAKMHVEAALKVKGRAMQEMSNEDSSFSIDELDAFTKNCYPLSNIK